MLSSAPERRSEHVRKGTLSFVLSPKSLSGLGIFDRKKWNIFYYAHWSCRHILIQKFWINFAQPYDEMANPHPFVVLDPL
jgi:hypothetical protein